MFSKLKNAGLVLVVASPALAQSGAQNSDWQPDLSAPAEYLAKNGGTATSVTDYGARPSDGRDDTRAFANAMSSARRNGRAVILVPAGTFELSETISLASGISIVGAGCERSRLARSPQFAGQIMFQMAGITDSRVQGLGFDFQNGPPYAAGIGLRGAGSKNVVILDNCFADTAARRRGGDRMAVGLAAETSPSARIWIGRNRALGDLQLTASGGAGVSILRIVDNHAHGSRNAAIAVTQTSSGANFSDIIIARNVIVRTHSLGIYLGPDVPSMLSGSFRNILIANNQIRGFTARFGHGIYFRAAERLTSGITLSGNQLDGLAEPERTAIRFEDDHGGGRRRFTNVVIKDNAATAFERGIWLSSIAGAVVRDNMINAGRDYMIDPAENWNVRLSK